MPRLMGGANSANTRTQDRQRNSFIVLIAMCAAVAAVRVLDRMYNNRREHKHKYEYEDERARSRHNPPARSRSHYNSASTTTTRSRGGRSKSLLRGQRFAELADDVPPPYEYEYVVDENDERAPEPMRYVEYATAAEMGRSRSHSRPGMRGRKHSQKWEEDDDDDQTLVDQPGYGSGRRPLMARGESWEVVRYEEPGNRLHRERY